MEYVPLDPLVKQALQAIEQRIGHELRCPMCGAENFSAVHNRILRLSTPLDMTEAEIDAATDSELYANVRAVALVCERCEFLATHLVPEEPDAEEETPNSD